MKSGIHPRYEPVVFRDRSSGEMFLSRSTRIPQETVELDGQTYPVIHVEISSTSHPFWTGQRREMDSEGRVERFRRRYGRVGSTQAGTAGAGDGAAAGEPA